MQLSRLAYGFVALALAMSLDLRSHAQPTVAIDGRSSVYQDSDQTFISTTTVALRGTIKDRVTIKARYLADIITSASVDVVSAATKSFDETRHELEGSVSYADGTRTASLGYVFSDENDWTSHSIRAGGSHDFFDHVLTLGAGGSITFNEVYRSGDINYRQDLTQGSVAVDATVVLSPADLVNATYTLMVLSGYQASPYRFVYIVSPSLANFTYSNPESVPDGRLRHALGLRWNRHIFSDSAIRSTLRGYLDDWGIVSATAGVEYVIGFGPIETAASVRGYIQNSAEFYEARYEKPMRYMTADRELSGFMDAFGGLRVGYRGSPLPIFHELRADLKAEVFAFHFFNFPRLENRVGIIGELGIGASF